MQQLSVGFARQGRPFLSILLGDEGFKFLVNEKSTSVDGAIEALNELCPPNALDYSVITILDAVIDVAATRSNAYQSARDLAHWIDHRLVRNVYVGRESAHA